MGKQVKGHTQWTSRTTTGKGCAVELNVEIWLMWKIETTGDQNGRRRNISVWDQISKAMNQTHYLSAMKRKPSREEHKIALASASQDIHWCHLPGHTSEFPCFWKESWVIQEKHAIAKQSESTSLVTEKPVKKKKKKNLHQNMSRLTCTLIFGVRLLAQSGGVSYHWSVEFKLPRSSEISSVSQLCPTLCNPKDCSMPGLPVHHQFPELAQTHVHWVSDAIQPSHLSLPSKGFNLSQHQGLFQWVTSLHHVAKVFKLQHRSF